MIRINESDDFLTITLDDVRNCSQKFVNFVKDLSNDLNKSHVEINLRGRRRFLLYKDNNEYYGRHSYNGKFNPSRDEDEYGTDYKAAARNASARVNDSDFLQVQLLDKNKYNNLY